MVGVIYSTKRPKADQSPYESMDAGMASCTGLSVLLIDACRSVGVPARFVGTPLWADGSGNHSWVEIWDDGWHFTGAAEPTGDQLNRAWFTDRASQAQPQDRMRSIYAVSYKRTPTTLPMVWRPDADSVYAVNVTQNYLKQPPVEEGKVRLRVRAVQANGDRIAAAVVMEYRLKSNQDDIQQQQTTTTHDESYDANDHLIFTVPKKGVLHLQLTVGEQNHSYRCEVPPDGSLLEFVFGKNMHAELFTPRDLLWKEHVNRIKKDRANELPSAEADKKGLRNGELNKGDLSFKYAFKTFGAKPSEGWSLFISMHGGGGAPTEVNDQQWVNQKRLYEPEEGIYLAPRASTDTWNLWHQSHIDHFMDRLIQNLVATEDVNPDRVYLMGYSAGGDGVYQLAPRMADRYAAAAMMAGHPNNANALGLRNLPFMIFMGGKDGAYGRNNVAAKWGERLDELQKGDSKGYEHKVTIYPQHGHWMNRDDREALPWMLARTRNPWPQKIVWHQSGRTHERFYWLAVPKGTAKGGQTVTAGVDGQTIVISGGGIKKLNLRLSDKLVDLDQPVVVTVDGKEVFKGQVARTVKAIWNSLQERVDVSSVGTGFLELEL